MKEQTMKWVKGVWIFFRDEIPLMLTNYRVLQIIMISFFMYWVSHLVLYITHTPFNELTEWQGAVPGATIAAMVAGLLASLQQLLKSKGD